MKQNRFTSKVMWAAIAGNVLGILVITGVITPTQSDTINTVIGLVLNSLSLLGIVNDPTNPNGI